MKQLTIRKKQCELYADLKLIDRCAARALNLVEKKDREMTMFVAKILSPFLPQLDNQTLQQVLHPFLINELDLLKVELLTFVN